MYSINFCVTVCTISLLQKAVDLVQVLQYISIIWAQCAVQICIFLECEEFLAAVDTDVFPNESSL